MAKGGRHNGRIKNATMYCMMTILHVQKTNENTRKRDCRRRKGKGNKVSLELNQQKQTYNVAKWYDASKQVGIYAAFQGMHVAPAETCYMVFTLNVYDSKVTRGKRGAHVALY